MGASKRQRRWKEGPRSPGGWWERQIRRAEAVMKRAEVAVAKAGGEVPDRAPVSLGGKRSEKTKTLFEATRLVVSNCEAAIELATGRQLVIDTDHWTPGYRGLEATVAGLERLAEGR